MLAWKINFLDEEANFFKRLDLSDFRVLPA